MGPLFLKKIKWAILVVHLVPILVHYLAKMVLDSTQTMEYICIKLWKYQVDNLIVLLGFEDCEFGPSFLYSAVRCPTGIIEKATILFPFWNVAEPIWTTIMGMSRLLFRSFCTGSKDSVFDPFLSCSAIRSCTGYSRGYQYYLYSGLSLSWSEH